jgi:hypothetical protein
MVSDNRNNAKNIIEINGKRYDAVTGTHMGESPARQHPASTASIDGFRRVSRQTAGMAPQKLKPIPARRSHPAAAATPVVTAVPAVSTAATAAPAAHTAAPTAASKSLDIAGPAHIKGVKVTPHRPQRATTLMRSAVKKPVITAPSVIKAQTRTDQLAKAPMQTVEPKISFNTVNHVRHQRAERMIKSPAISRYSGGTPAPTTPVYKLTPMPAEIARPAPHYKDIHHTQPQQPAHHQIAQGHGNHQPTAIQHHVKEPAHTEQDLDIFQQALADARSHEQTYEHKGKRSAKKRGRMLGLLTGGVVSVMLLGYFAYQNVPDLSLKVASYRAGLHAKLPAQSPSGFNFGYLDYKPGNVTANFTSPADGRQFNITQKSSDWDSQALLSNFVSSANSAYKTYQRAGRTVYLLGNNTATWVDSGIWYTVDGNSSLSSSQLLELATSM